MAQYVAGQIKEAQFVQTTLDRLRRYIGVVDSGGAQLSTNTKEKYRAAMFEKHRGRRSR